MTDEEGIRLIKRVAIGGVVVLTAIGTLMGSWYTIPEGHVGIVTRFSKAVYQVDPGLHFKVPWVDGVERIEVRQRRNTEEMSAATSNQLPMTASVSINWTVNKEAAFDIFVKYGGLDQFETRILDPKFRQAVKTSLSKYRADELIRQREVAANAIQVEMIDLMESFPVTVNSPQIENIVLPEQYMNAVLAKEQARENAEKERHILDQQKLQAQQAVNTAEADRDSVKARADGEAYKRVKEAEAEAQAIKAKAFAEAEGLAKIAKSLAENPQLIQYEQVKRWTGDVPTTVLGNNTSLLYSLQK